MIHNGVTSIVLVILGFGVLALSFFFEDSYLVLSFGFVILSIFLFIVRFESRKVEPRELVLLAVLAAIAAASRIPFASIPSVQPTTFVIMISGFVFGPESGFIIGAVAALASNMIIGQGPWTPWQMFAWGLVGLTAGLLQKTKLTNSNLGRIIFGAIWGFLFGWIMNMWGFLALMQSDSNVDLKGFLLYFTSSAMFDSIHAITNVVFLFIFGNSWIKIFTRFKRKYGLLK